MTFLIKRFMDKGSQEHNAVVSFIWGIADGGMPDAYVHDKYLDAILEDSRLRTVDTEYKPKKK